MKIDPENVRPSKSASRQTRNTTERPMFDMIVLPNEVVELEEAVNPEAVPAKINSPTLIPPRCIAA